MRPLSRYFFLASLFAQTMICVMPSLGNTVINIPPDIAPRTIGANTIVNVLPGGTFDVRGAAIASDGAVVNVFGGRVGELVVKTNAVVNVENGGVHERFWAEDNGKIFLNGGRTESIFLRSTGLAEIHGGAIETIGAQENSSLVIKGVNFAIDGVPVSGLDQVDDRVSVNLSLGSVLTAVLADGTPFGRFQQSGASATIIRDGVLTLQRSTPPPTPVAGTTIIDTASDLAFVGLGQTVLVNENGRLQEQFRAGPGSRIEVNGGRIDAALHAIGADVLITDGNVGRRLNAYDNAVVTIRGGLLNGDARFYRGSILNVEGGEVGGGIWMRDGATLNMSGGQIFEVVGFGDSVLNIRGGEANRLRTASGKINLLGGSVTGSIDLTGTGVAEFSGGRQTDNISARAGGQVVVRGSEFRIDGVPLPSLLQMGDTTSVDLTENTTFSGVYSDGTPFVLHGKQEDIRSAITVIESATLAPGPSIVRVPSDPVPLGVRNGQTLILNDGGELPDNFTAGDGSVVLVQGGVVGRNFEIAGAVVNLSGGEIGFGLDAFAGAVLNISGTASWTGLDAHAGSVTTVSGGSSTGEGIDAFPGAIVNVTGGQIKGLVQAEGATVNISGGVFTGLRQREHRATAGSTVNFSGGSLVGSGLQVLSGSRLFASGGEMKRLLISRSTALINGTKIELTTVADDSVVDMVDGDIGDTDILQGGVLRFFGGTMADSHEWLSGVGEMHGYDFQIDGVPIAGLDAVGNTVPLSLPEGSFFSGVLSDGTPFAISSNDEFQSVVIRDGVVSLTKTEAPALPQTITLPNGTAPRGIAGNRSLSLVDGGKLHDNFVAGPGSTVEIRGGEVGENFEADRSNVTVFGGVVGERADAFSGSVFTISGGVVGQRFEAHGGSVLNITGGELGRLSDALPGSEINISGGVIGSSFDAIGATVTITGGQIESGFEASDGAMIIIDDGIIGANFEARSDSRVDIRGGQIGSGFEVRENAVVNVRGGVFEGGFAARGEGVVVNFFGGVLDRSLLAGEGATINIDGGQIGDSFDVHRAEVNISGGTIGDRFRLRTNAKVIMTGGTVGDRFEISDQAEMIITGGEFGDFFRAFDGSTVIIEGFGFELDGVSVPGLGGLGDLLVVDDRGGALLTGFFADGSPFQFQLNDIFSNPPQSLATDPGPGLLLASELTPDVLGLRDTTFDFFSLGATLQIVSSVPEPASGVLMFGLVLTGLLTIRGQRSTNDPY